MSSEWPMQDLGSLISYRKGFAFKSKDYISSGVPIVRVSNFTDDSISPNDLKFVSPDVAKETPEVSLEVNDIVVATVGSWPNNPASVVGRTIRVPAWAESALMNQNSVIIRAKSKSLTDQKFIYYQMRSQDFSAHVVSKAQGSANQASITLDAIFSYRLFWPKVEHRDVIVTFLSHLDDRITLLRETNTTLEAIAQGLFKSWFVDFDPVYARARGEQPPGLAPEVAALFPDSFEESELGMIPKGWSIGRISDLGDVVCGKTPPTSEPDNYGDDVPFITIPDMHRHLVVTSTTRALSKKGADSQPKKYLPVGSICVSCIATPGLVVQVTEPSHTNQQINSVIPQPKWGRSFPLFLLRRIGDKVHAGGSGGSVFHNLSKSGFEKIPELLPTTKLAQEYCQIVDPLVDKITDNQRYAQTLATLRDTLLPRLISGQLRLPEAEAMVREVQE